MTDSHDPRVGYDPIVAGRLMELLRSDAAPWIARIAAPGSTDVDRLAYATELQARQDPKGELLALAVALASPRPQSEEGSRERLAALLKWIAIEDPEWWAIVRPAQLILNCGAALEYEAEVRFAYACPKVWAELVQTETPGVRSCAHCAREVFQCETVAEVARRARVGDCVAVPLRLTGRFEVDTTHMVGRPAHPVRRWASHLFPRPRIGEAEALRRAKAFAQPPPSYILSKPHLDTGPQSILRGYWEVCWWQHMRPEGARYVLHVVVNSETGEVAHLNDFLAGR